MDADCKAVYGSGPLYTTDIKASLPIFIPPGATGVAALPPVTLPQMFHSTAGKYPGGKAVMWRVPDDVTSHNQPYSFYANLATKAVGSHWEGMSWAQLEQQCYVFANACLAMGFGDKDACVVMGFNTPQWLIAFHGSMMAGGVISGSYPTNGKDTCEYLASDCGAKLVLAESWTHGSKFEALLNDSSHKLSKIVIWGDTSPVPPALLSSGKVVSFPEFMASGDETKAKVAAIEAKLKPGECCSLIYTSGTTGPPKGVMLSHDCLTWDANAAVDFFTTNFKHPFGPDQVFLSYLPLSHIAAQVLDFMMAVQSGGCLYFATPDALSGGLLPLLQQTRPTFFFGVPRVWEKVMDAMKAKSAAGSPTQKKIALAAKAVGLARNLGLIESGGVTSGQSCVDTLKYFVFKAIVFKKVKKTLGLDRCFAFGSGAAPIAKEVLQFFWALDIPIIEGFGMSETTAIMTSSAWPAKLKLGTVGTAICHGAVMLDTVKGRDFAPEDKATGKREEGHGEICLRGRNVMMGYLNKPEKSAETFDASRFLRSGDLGKFLPCADGSGDQLLAITGRIKELIITAGGENVPPVLIEDQVKAHCPMVSNAVLLGDKRKFLACLLTLRVVVDAATLQPTSKLDANCLLAMRAIGSAATTVDEAKVDPKVAAAIQAGLDKANANAASRAQKIQKFVVLDGDLSVPGGELTATQKLKRDVVNKKYSALIESMYAEKA